MSCGNLEPRADGAFHADEWTGSQEHGHSLPSLVVWPNGLVESGLCTVWRSRNKEVRQNNLDVFENLSAHLVDSLKTQASEVHYLAHEKGWSAMVNVNGETDWGKSMDPCFFNQYL